jgi:hypothetical protein
MEKMENVMLLIWLTLTHQCWFPVAYISCYYPSGINTPMGRIIVLATWPTRNLRGAISQMRGRLSRHSSKAALLTKFHVEPSAHADVTKPRNFWEFLESLSEKNKRRRRKKIGMVYVLNTARRRTNFTEPGYVEVL